MLHRCVWSRNIKNGCSIYIYIYDISRLRVKSAAAKILLRHWKQMIIAWRRIFLIRWQSLYILLLHYSIGCKLIFWPVFTIGLFSTSPSFLTVTQGSVVQRLYKWFHVLCFLLGNSAKSEFYMPTFRNTLFHLHTFLWRWKRQCSETSAYKIQTPENYPEENAQHTEHGESLKSSDFKLHVTFPVYIS